MSAADAVGIVAGSVGAATGIAGLVLGVLSERRAGRAERAAAEASAGADSVEQSLQRIADSFEQNRQVRERELAVQFEQLTGRPLTIDLTHGDQFGSPAFAVEYVRGHAYRLRNVGAGAASNVSVAVPNFPVGLTRRLPAGVDLAPGASTEQFVIHGAAGAPTPGEVMVTCAELDEPAVAPLPRRP